MSARIQAAGVGLFVVVMLALGIGMAVVIENGSFWGDNRMRYELVYKSSVKGLVTGAPVTLKGVQIGDVVSVKARFYQDSNTPLNSVVMDIDPGRIDFNEDTHGGIDNILLESGLSAKLKTQSLLTGLLYIELDFYSDEPQKIAVDTTYPQMSTVPSDLDKLDNFDDIDFVQLAKNLETMMQNMSTFTSSEAFQGLPERMSDTLATVTKTFAAMEVSAVTMNETFVAFQTSAASVGNSAESFGKSSDEAMKSMQKSMVSLQQTAQQVNAHLKPDSPVIYNLNKSLESVNRAARAVEQLVETLEQQPEAVITGKRNVQR